MSISNSPYKPSLSNETSLSKFIDSLFDRVHTLEQVVNRIGSETKITKKRRFATKKSGVVLNGLTRALCVETIDPYKMNRVRFFHPLLHNPKATVWSLPFAKPISAMGGFDDCGLNWVPPAGSTLMLLFEGGSVDSAFYLGTAWHKDRGVGGKDIMEIFPSREYQAVYQGHRKGYLVGPDDESQVYPPWNTESYNSGDIFFNEQFSLNPFEQRRSTYPNIYGFKTPEKHMVKMVDGNAKCNRRWKRMELMSSCGNWMIFKDDHLHYGGQWAHPKCPPNPGGSPIDVCSNHDSTLPYFSNFHGTPIEKSAGCEPNCECPREEGQSCSPTQCSNILGGHTPTPCEPNTKHCNSQSGSNNFFKHKNECRPYRGPGTPQNNRCDLPQTGIQFLSISGHSWVMDDSVEEPSGAPIWERSMDSFNFGCNNKYLGRTYWKSATGHSILMSDVEELSELRGKDNFIRIKSATGNKIELNDHTVGEPEKGCPPNYAGEERGIHLESTSTHKIKMIDHMNEQCSPKRQEGGTPTPKATKAYIQIRSGYGLEMRFNDDFSQQQTQSQWIQILHPQCVDPNSDDTCNSKEGCGYRGPHILRFQGRPKGQAGVVFLRAGGHSIRQTYDMDVVIVGDKECNPSDKFTYVSKNRTSAVENIDFRYAGEEHIFVAGTRISLLAGRDCPPPPGKKCKGPCTYPVIIARCPIVCPITRIVHWSIYSVSERVFASGWQCLPPPIPGENGPCSEDEESSNSIDTGAGVINI